MKKRLFLFAALSVLFACQVEDDFGPYEPTNPRPGDESVAIPSVRLSFSSVDPSTAPSPTSVDPSTKTAWDGTTVVWSVGDRMGLGYTYAGGTWDDGFYESDPLTTSSNKTNFDVTITGGHPGPFNFYTIFPISSVSDYAGGIAIVNIPGTQTPGASTFDPASDIMTGTGTHSFVSFPDTQIPIDWTRLVAHGDITLKNLSITSGETIEKVVFTAQEGAELTGEFLVDMTDGSATANNASNTVTALADNLVYSANTLRVWVGMMPATITELTVEVVTNHAKYTRSISSLSLDFAVNARNTLGVNMSSAVRTPKVYTLVTSAPADWSGEYIIVNGTNVLTGKSGSGNYGAYTSVTVTENKVTLAEAGAYNIVIAPSANGYTLKQGDYYLGLTSDNNNLFFSTDPSTNTYEWTLSYSAGASHVFSVSYPEREIEWNSSSPRFACYKSNLQSISLYRLEFPSAGGSGGGGGGDPVSPTRWLELPVYSLSSMSGTTTSSLGDLYDNTVYSTMGGNTVRNYSYLYDPEMYASYWVAYPLCADHLGSGRDESWAFDPNVPSSKQTKLTNGAYGVSVASANYASQYYARGHQIPNADRNGVDEMMAETYYMTNLTPQLQNGFNGGIWSSLEGAVRGLTSSCDTVYVVTGAAFRKKGGSETVNTIVNTRDSKTVAVPNYYWKVLLKVKRSGDGITDASAVGFWLEHREYISDSYTNYAVSVDQIETWTGFDFFPEIGDYQTAAESNTSWSTFQAF